MREYERLLKIWKKTDKSISREKTLLVPRYISLMRKCVEHKIQDSIICRSHFNDLYVLILSLDIADIKTALKQRSAAKWNQKGIEIQDVSQTDAVKFLKGG